MHVEGKDLPIGKYLFHRYLTFNGEKRKVNTYKIEKTTDGYKLYDSQNTIDDEIRRIELKKKLHGFNLEQTFKIRIII